MDMSLKLASSYFDMLKSLSDEAKLHLIKMLTDSILKKEAKNRTGNGKLEDLFGVWADDPETDHMEENIRKERTSNRTRKIVSFNECNGD